MFAKFNPEIEQSDIHRAMSAYHEKYFNKA